MYRLATFVIAFCIGLSTPVLSVEPDEILSDPALEERARAISQQLRCLVCQNESIDSSNADVARDLRVIVRERLQAGDSDEEIIDFVVGRYGDFVLLNPPLRSRTVLLWATPAILLGAGGLLIFLFYRNMAGRRVDTPDLSPDEKQRLERYLGS